MKNRIFKNILLNRIIVIILTFFLNNCAALGLFVVGYKNESEIIGLDKKFDSEKKIIKEFGKPDEEIILNSNCKKLKYNKYYFDPKFGGLLSFYLTPFLPIPIILPVGFLNDRYIEIEICNGEIKNKIVRQIYAKHDLIFGYGIICGSNDCNGYFGFDKGSVNPKDIPAILSIIYMILLIAAFTPYL